MVKKILSLYLISFLVCPAIVLGEEAEDTNDGYAVVPLETGDPAPFDGVLLSFEAAARVLVERRFEDAECDLRVEYELKIQRESFQLQLDFKDIEIHSWKDKYESMMILKSAENDRLEKLILKQDPNKAPWIVALGFGIGTLTSLGIFALSTEIVQSE